MKRNVDPLKKARTIKKGLLEKAGRTLDHCISMKSTCTCAMTALTADIQDVKSSHHVNREVTAEALAVLTSMARQWRTDLRRIDMSIIQLEESMENIIMATQERRSPVLTAMTMYGSDSQLPCLQRGIGRPTDVAVQPKDHVASQRDTETVHRVKQTTVSHATLEPQARQRKQTSRLQSGSKQSGCRTSERRIGNGQLHALSQEILKSRSSHEASQNETTLLGCKTEGTLCLNSSATVDDGSNVVVSERDNEPVRTTKSYSPRNVTANESNECAIPRSPTRPFFLPKLAAKSSLTSFTNLQNSLARQKSSSRRKKQ